MDESSRGGFVGDFGVVDGLVVRNVRVNYNDMSMSMINFEEKNKKSIVETTKQPENKMMKKSHESPPLLVDPITMPEVLEKVLSYISLKELNSLKQISKMWKLECNRQILLRGRVNLVKIDKLMAYNQNYRSFATTTTMLQKSSSKKLFSKSILRSSKSNVNINVKVNDDGGAGFFPHNAFKIRLSSPYDSPSPTARLDTGLVHGYKLHLDSFFNYFGQLYVRDLHIDTFQPRESELRDLLSKHTPYLQVLILNSPPSDKAYIDEASKLVNLQDNNRERMNFNVHDDHEQQLEALNIHNLERYRRRAQLAENNNMVPFIKSNISEPMENLELPYLKELRIESVKGPIQALNLKRFLKFIFASALNLRKITVRSGGNVLTEEEERIPLEAILESDEETELRKLMYMDFPSEFVLRESDVLKLKKKLPPSLRSLNLTFMPNVRAESIHNLILQRFNFGLEHLELNFSENMAKPNLVFPTRLASSILVNLRSLKLKGYRGLLSFATSLPKLEIIEVNGISEDFRENLFFEPSDLQPSSSGTTRNNKIQVFRSDTQISNRNLESLSSFSSIIQTLELSYLNDDGLRIIFMNLPLIKTLKLRVGSFTDSGVSGVSELLCKELIDTETHVAEFTPANFRSSLFIGSLPYLSTLMLESAEIGDLSVSFGLTSCFKLKHLTLASPKITQIGIALLERVIVQSQMESIDLTNCSTHLSPDIDILKKRNYSIEIKDPRNPADNSVGHYQNLLMARRHPNNQNNLNNNNNDWPAMDPLNILIPEDIDQMDDQIMDHLANNNNNNLNNMFVEDGDNDEDLLHLHDHHELLNLQHILL